MNKEKLESRREYFELRRAEDLDHVDTSLSTIAFRNRRIREIQEQYPKESEGWEDKVCEQIRKIEAIRV